MLPAILVSCICTLLSVALKDLFVGPYIVSSLAALNSFLLAVISYLKLDAKSEAHKTSAYMYDKLGTLCEFNSGKVMFFRPDDQSPEDFRKEIVELVHSIETKITEIKDTNKFIIPEIIRYRFKELYSQNIFSDVKELQIKDLILKTELKGILSNYDVLKQNHQRTPEEESNYQSVVTEKDNKIIEIIRLRKEYSKLDEKFKKEINHHVHRIKAKGFTVFRWLKT